MIEMIRLIFKNQCRREGDIEYLEQAMRLIDIDMRAAESQLLKDTAQILLDELQTIRANIKTITKEKGEK